MTSGIVVSGVLVMVNSISVGVHLDSSRTRSWVKFDWLPEPYMLQKFKQIF